MSSRGRGQRRIYRRLLKKALSPNLFDNEAGRCNQGFQPLELAQTGGRSARVRRLSWTHWSEAAFPPPSPLGAFKRSVRDSPENDSMRDCGSRNLLTAFFRLWSAFIVSSEKIPCCHTRLYRTALYKHRCLRRTIVSRDYIEDPGTS